MAFDVGNWVFMLVRNHAIIILPSLLISLSFFLGPVFYVFILNIFTKNMIRIYT